MGHTPSTPEVKQPLSATDPRFSTSGILNAHNKEKNRQGLLSTYGGRTGEAMDINKFAENKISMRDPSAVPVLEQLAKYYSAARTNNAKGNTDAYNKNVQNISDFLSGYGAKDAGLQKANVEKKTITTPYTSWSGPGTNHTSYRREVVTTVTNQDAINKSMDNINKQTEIFNQVAKNAKKQNPAKK